MKKLIILIVLCFASSVLGDVTYSHFYPNVPLTLNLGSDANEWNLLEVNDVNIHNELRVWNDANIYGDLQVFGGVKLATDAMGNVTLFEDANVGDEEWSKILYLYRKAPEGDNYLRFLIDATPSAFIQADTTLKYDIAGAIVSQSSSYCKFVSTGSYIWFSTAGGNPMYFDCGTNFLFRDRDATNATRVTIASATGDITTVGDIKTAADANIGGELVVIDDANIGGALTVAGTLGIKGAAHTYDGLNIASVDGNDLIGIYHDNSNAQFRTTDGSFNFETVEENYNTVVEARGNGTGMGIWRTRDENNDEYAEMLCTNGRARFYVSGVSPVAIDFQPAANVPIRMFINAANETPELQIYGMRDGDVKRNINIGISPDVNDTALFSNVSNYVFDGTIKATDANISGELIVIDDANIYGNLTVAGTLGIGTTTPNNKLQVAGLINFDDGNGNTFLGTDAFKNDEGAYNLGIGHNAGYFNDTTGAGNEGWYNVYMGRNAGYGGTPDVNNTGFQNIFLGDYAGYYNTSGFSNVYLGTKAGESGTSATQNFALGAFALRYNVLGDYNICIGGYAGMGVSGQSQWHNTLIGYQNAQFVTTGHYNTCLGSGAGHSLTSGRSNIFLGYNSGYRQSTLYNLLIIDNQDRESDANEITDAILYGVMADTPADQTLRINAEILGSVGAKIGDGGTTNYLNISNTGDLTFVGTAGLVFGSCYGNHIGWTQANAVEDQWYDINDVDMISGPLNGVTHDSNGLLTVTEPGMYHVTWSCCFENNTANDHVEIGISISGTVTGAGMGHLENKFASEEEHLSSSAILDLADNAILQLSIRTTDAVTPDFIVDGINISCIQIGGT